MATNRTQAHRFAAVATPLGDDKLLLRSFHGTDALSRPFQYTLSLFSEQGGVKADDILGQNVTIRLETPSGDTRYFNGYVSRFVQTRAEGRLFHYQATIVPWLWLLTRNADCRIFQEKTVPDIVKEIFRDRGFTDFDDSLLTGSYQPKEYCVQYRETDFNFVSRLLEQEGIHYFFRHEDGKHTLVLADMDSSHEACPSAADKVVYRTPGQGNIRTEHLCEWMIEYQVQPGAYALHDFDFTNPKTPVAASSTVSRTHANAEFEIFDYPGEYATEDEGQTFAKARINEFQSQYEVVSAKGDVYGVVPGHTFHLEEHPDPGQCKDYLVVSATYQFDIDDYTSGNGSGGGGGPIFSCGLTAIDAQQPYSPPRLTPKPIIQGPQTALVCGKSGEEIWTDEHGRVKVQFHWDRYSKADENSSCWMRVAQVWAGKKWGGMYMPRVGQEVIVEFLEGDPDRPIVTGRVYNGECKPPYALPDNKTMSTTKSLSSKGGGGFNEIRFEDKKGEEQIFIHAEKNQDLRIKNDVFEWVGHDRHLIVVNDQREKIDHDLHQTIANDHVEAVGKDHHLKVTGKQAIAIGGSHSLTVKGDCIEVFKANHSEETTSNYYLKAMQVVIEGSTGVTIKCGGNAVVIDSSGVTIKGSMVTVDGSMVKIASGPGSPAGSGSAGSAVSPTAPTAPEEADTADPGEMAELKARQREQKKGKYGSTPVKPYKPPETEEEKQTKTAWIEIEMVDEANKPVVGQKYSVELPDGSTCSGTLDDKGLARIEGIDPGNCKITFPDLDQDAWEKL